mgnify:CR=1 FL=1
MDVARLVMVAACGLAVMVVVARGAMCAGATWPAVTDEERAKRASATERACGAIVAGRAAVR